MDSDVTGVNADDGQVEAEQEEMNKWLLMWREVSAKKRQILELESMSDEESKKKAERLRADVTQLESTVGAPPEQWRVSEPRIAGDLPAVEWVEDI